MPPTPDVERWSGTTTAQPPGAGEGRGERGQHGQSLHRDPDRLQGQKELDQGGHRRQPARQTRLFLPRKVSRRRPDRRAGGGDPRPQLAQGQHHKAQDQVDLDPGEARQAQVVRTIDSKHFLDFRDQVTEALELAMAGGDENAPDPWEVGTTARDSGDAEKPAKARERGRQNRRQSPRPKGRPKGRPKRRPRHRKSPRPRRRQKSRPRPRPMRRPRRRKSPRQGAGKVRGQGAGKIRGQGADKKQEKPGPRRRQKSRPRPRPMRRKAPSQTPETAPEGSITRELTPAGTEKTPAGRPTPARNARNAKNARPSRNNTQNGPRRETCTTFSRNQSSGMETSSGKETASLPGTLEALTKGSVDSFPALRAHQQHSWHTFLVQIAAGLMHREGSEAISQPAAANGRNCSGPSRPNIPGTSPGS